jgi:DNA-binding transcriptional LysR family regulator
MELRQLEQFVAVAEELNFTRAADRLRIAQSGLSVSIRGLERDLRATLFLRSSHGVRLTEAGVVLLSRARDLLVAAQSTRDAVTDVVGGVRGTVRVGIMQGLVLPGLAELLAQFRRSNQLVQIEPHLAANGSTSLAKEVAQGRLDIAFAALHSTQYHSSLVVTPLGSEPMRLVLPASHELALRRTIPLKDLDGEVFVEFPSGWGTRILIDAQLARLGLTRTVSIEVSDVVAAGELVRAGFGMAFLPRSVIKRQPGLVVRPVHPSPRLELNMVTPSPSRLNAASRALAARVQEFYASGPTLSADSPAE